MNMAVGNNTEKPVSEMEEGEIVYNGVYNKR